MDQSTSSTQGDITFGMYVVGLIDVLNQGNQLERWKEFPESPEETGVFIDAARETVGAVDALRKRFEGFIGAFTSRQHQHPAHACLTAAQTREFERLSNSGLRCQCFSDTCVVYSPLAIGGGDTTVRGVYGMLMGGASILLTELARGTPLRGGIEIGMGTCHFPNEIYGPVLACAHRLEQSVAKYPRIVVGNELIAYLRGCLHGTEETPSALLNADLAGITLPLIATDDDVPFIDFLGDTFRQSVSQRLDFADDVKDDVKKGLEFVTAEHERFTSLGDRKLAGCYARLKQYYESRAPRWFC